jgi:hypothetical protein
VVEPGTDEDALARRLLLAKYQKDVRGRREGLKRFKHPKFGCFDLEFTSFQVDEQPSLRLSLYTPADDGRSETKLREIIA